VASKLLATKPLSLLLEEMGGENRLHRVLGPVQLSALGVGAIIGTGIFVLTGEAAHDRTGPALMLSFVVAGIACVFAALCYAEFASMVPVAGSAYTYAYATLGEIFAWIIGWDLVLEYAIGSSTVAHGWSAHFREFIPLLGLHVPKHFATAPFDYLPATGEFIRTGSYFDLPAIAITFILTLVLVKGIRESAGFNAVMVAIKLAIVLLVIGIGVTVGIAILVAAQARLGMIPLEKEPTMEMSGWPSIARELDERGLVGKPGTFLFTGRWFTSGHLAFAIRNRGPVKDLWDLGFSVGDPPLTVSYALIAIVGLLSLEWLTRKLLKLA
jgi:amino acid transporter